MSQVTQTKADLILFTHAFAILDELDNLCGEFNAVAEALDELGYRRDLELVCADEPGMPRVEVNGGCTTIEGVRGHVTEAWKQGRIVPLGNRKKANPRSFNLACHRRRLGIESNWTCGYCGEQGTEPKGPDGRMWHVDHLYPVANGGDGQPDNLVLACASCNIFKNGRTLRQHLRKLLQENSRLKEKKNASADALKDLPVSV